MTSMCFGPLEAWFMSWQRQWALAKSSFMRKSCCVSQCALLCLPPLSLALNGGDDRIEQHSRSLTFVDEERSSHWHDRSTLAKAKMPPAGRFRRRREIWSCIAAREKKVDMLFVTLLLGFRCLDDDRRRKAVVADTVKMELPCAASTSAAAIGIAAEIDPRSSSFEESDWSSISSMSPS
jgi:hypothetical protein